MSGRCIAYRPSPVRRVFTDYAAAKTSCRLYFLQHVRCDLRQQYTIHPATFAGTCGRRSGTQPSVSERSAMLLASLPLYATGVHDSAGHICVARLEDRKAARFLRFQEA